MDSRGTFRRCFDFIIVTHNDALELFFFKISVQFSSVQSLSRVRLFVTP